MRDLKIGKLLITKKAILLIAFCLFLNGMAIGALVALDKKETNNSMNVLILFVTLFVPYILFFKSIRRNVIELK